MDTPTATTFGRRRLPTLAALVAIAMIVVACSGAAAPILAPVGGETDAGGQPVPAEEPQSGYDTNGQRYADDGSVIPGAPVDDARIVRTGWLSLRVTDLEPAVGSAHDRIIALGGYVSASNQVNTEDASSATVTYRVPVDRWEDALAALRDVADEVVDERTEAVEVTSQIVDLDARIRNLRASETALIGILEQATRIPDVLEVQRELTATREQIEQLEAQKALLEDQADLATITATFGVEVVAVTQAATGWDPGTIIDEAAASLVELLQGLATAGIWFVIVVLPVLLAVAVVGLVAWFVVRRATRSMRTRPPTPPTTSLPAAPAD